MVSSILAVKKNINIFLFIAVFAVLFLLPKIILGAGIESSNGTSVVSCSYNPGTWIDGCFVPKITYIVLWLVSWFLYFSGILFNYSLGMTLNIKDYVDQMKIKDIWGIFRDLANITFIFILLYIAIATILQLNSFDTKKTLSKLVIVALLINFSFFFTSVVIDSSNILACSFYKSMISNGSTAPCSSIKNMKDDGGISELFMKGVNLTSIYDVKGNKEKSKNILGDVTKSLTITTLGSILILITAFVFLAAAIMLIIRTVTLIILLILSPIAFAGYILPSTSGWTKKWWESLIGQSFFAPIFLLMIWVVLKIMENIQNNPNLATGSFTNVVNQDNNNDWVSLVFNFAILIALTIAALTVSKMFAGGVATTSIGWASKASGAVGGFVGRNTVGRALNKYAQSDFGKAHAAKGGFGNLASFAKYGGRASFDVRGVGIPGVTGGSAGGAGGFATIQKAQKDNAEDSMVEHYNSLDDDGKKKYLRELANDEDNKKNKKKMKALFGKLSSDKIADVDDDGVFSNFAELETDQIDKIDKARAMLESKRKVKEAKKSVDLFKTAGDIDVKDKDGNTDITKQNDKDKKMMDAINDLSKSLDNSDINASDIASLKIPAGMIKKNVVEKMSIPQFNKVVNSDSTGQKTLDAFKDVISSLGDDSHIKQAAFGGGSTQMKYISGHSDTGNKRSGKNNMSNLSRDGKVSDQNPDDIDTSKLNIENENLNNK